jgi:3-oxoadipate enol-lactonase
MNMPTLLHSQWHQGKAGSPTILLIHPLGADLTFWNDCIACWGPDVSTLACDLRSAGRSPGSPVPVTIEQHVADLEVLCLELGIGSIVLVGCAIGAMIATRYAATHSDVTQALVLVSPTPKTTPMAAKMLADRAELVSLSGLPSILPDAIDKAFEQQVKGTIYQHYFQRFVAQNADAYVQSIRGILNADVTADLQSIQCPTLVLGAGHDLLLPPALSLQVHEMVKNSEFDIMTEAAHFAPLQHPERFAERVSSFLARNGILQVPLTN